MVPLYSTHASRFLWLLGLVVASCTETTKWSNLEVLEAQWFYHLEVHLSTLYTKITYGYSVLTESLEPKSTIGESQLGLSKLSLRLTCAYWKLINSFGFIMRLTGVF